MKGGRARVVTRGANSFGGEVLFLHRRDAIIPEYAFLLGEEEIGYVARGQTAEATATGEFYDQVWQIQYQGFRPLRVLSLTTESTVPNLVFLGSPSWGLAQSRRGRAFRYFSRLDLSLGPGSGFEDSEGRRVFWSRGRIAPGFAAGYEIQVGPSPGNLSDLAGLLLTWASFNLFRTRRLLAQVGAIGLSPERLEREMDRTLRSLAARDQL
jgi:hypothetical protein